LASPNPPPSLMSLDAYLRATFKSATISRASIPEGLRQRVQERILRDIQPRLASSTLAFASGMHVGGFAEGGNNVRGVPPPFPVRKGWLPEDSQGQTCDQLVPNCDLPGSSQDASSEQLPSETKPCSADQPQAPDVPYARGFRHGFAVAALNDLAVQPLQEAVVDPYLRPNPTDAPRAALAYDVGMGAGRACLTDKGAAAVLVRLGARGTTGVLGCTLGGLLYTAVKELVRWKFDGPSAPAPSEDEVQPPASIIYDEKCSVCMEELEPGKIIILAHGESGHACICTTCFPIPEVRAALHVCPLCRQRVNGHVRT